MEVAEESAGSSNFDFLLRYPGTGIGLAVVERGISRMGGKVRVPSAPSKENTFSVEVQAAQARGLVRQPSRNLVMGIPP
jgi:signal transduction histidine kinase